MLTLLSENSTKIASIVTGRNRSDLFWYPFKESEKQIQVLNYNEFDTEEFRNRFTLSKKQSSEIMSHLTNQTEPEGVLQQKYFQIKKFIDDSLYQELDFRKDSDTRLVIDLPPNPTSFAGHESVIGSTASGKTFYVYEKCIRNITGPKKSRRPWIWISSEYNVDKTIKHFRTKLAYQKYVYGIDVSERSYEESEHTTREEFFIHEIKHAVDVAEPGTMIVCDDFRDAACAQQMRLWINTALRVSRHELKSFIIIFHSIRAGSWSAQSHNSVKYVTLFPRSQKGKIVQYLNQDHAIPLKRAREIVDDFASQRKGRHMTVHIHSPNFFAGTDLLRLF